MENKALFNNITQFVIDNLEGGYYHPNMLKDGRVTDQRYKNSGETMFGIDRLAGGSINKTPAGIKFWSIIDNANAKNFWKWNYKGGSLAPQLKELVGEIMFPVYNNYAKLYFSNQSKNIVEKDNRLLFNFIYASWNGPAWFKMFAEKINTAIASGITNTDKLTEIAIKTRKNSTNSLIKQGGSIIEKIIDQLKKKNEA
jgi:hypothetical protein